MDGIEYMDAWNRMDGWMDGMDTPFVSNVFANTMKRTPSTPTWLSWFIS